MYKLLIVDDEYIVRTGLRQTIDWASLNIEVVGEAASGAEGMRLITELQPDIVLTDIRMQGMGGLEMLNRVRTMEMDCEVIIISGYEEFDYVREALKCGAFAYLVKPIDNAELIETVQNAIDKLVKNRSRNKYFERLSSELTAVKRQFLRDLLGGLITNTASISEKLEFYMIELKTGPSVAVYIKIIKIDSYNSKFFRSVTTADITRFVDEAILSRLDTTGVVVDLSDCDFAIIINAENVNLSLLRALFMDACHDFCKQAEFSISVGIGNRVSELSAISASFKNAKNTVSGTKNIGGINTVISFDDIQDFGYKREIQAAIKYICEHYAEDVTIDLVANELYISPSYLMHLFKEKLGKTFNECLTEYRITTARELLSLNKYKIYEVSNMIGYKDVKYFSQIFKKIVGITPSEFSKNAASSRLID